MLFKFSAAAVLYLLGAVSAAGISNPGYLQLSTKGVASNTPVTKVASLAKSKGYDNINLDNLYYSYQVSIGLGTPQQTVELAIDTGSSDLWVMSPKNPYCAKSTAQINEGYPDCSTEIVYDHTKSSTYKANSTAFSIEYGDGTTATGNYFQDVLQFGSAKLKGANAALATKSDSSSPVFGIGLRWTEATATGVVNGELSPTYDNIPIQLVQQGFIASNAYSLWLDDLEASEGSVLFGAIDKTKYSGTLATVPIINTAPGQVDYPYTLTVLLNEVSYNGNKLSYGSLPVLLDSGTSYAYLPTALVAPIANQIGFTLNSNDGFYEGSCSSISSSATLDFNFQGKTISAPLTDFTGTVSGSTCALLIVPSDDGTYILGDLFLRAAYVVYDLDNYQIGLAQAKYGATATSDIALITKGIPSATQAPSYSQTSWSTVFTSVA